MMGRSDGGGVSLVVVVVELEEEIVYLRSNG